MYTVNPQHRDGNWRKSQWTISEAAEIGCFEYATACGWILGGKGWGFYLQGEALHWLGRAIDQQTLLFIAKFVGSGNPILWHGYPADHQRNNHDIPPKEILRSWLESAHLSPAKLRKIAKGQPCNL